MRLWRVWEEDLLPLSHMVCGEETDPEMCPGHIYGSSSDCKLQNYSAHLQRENVAFPFFCAAAQIYGAVRQHEHYLLLGEALGIFHSRFIPFYHGRWSNLIHSSATLVQHLILSSCQDSSFLQRGEDIIRGRRGELK